MTQPQAKEYLQPPETGKEQVFPQGLWTPRVQPRNSGTLASRTIRGKIAVVQTPKFVATYYSSWKLIHCHGRKFAALIQPGASGHSGRSVRQRSQEASVLVDF